MKALTVWQPWASLIAIGAKPYEFRGWAPPASIIGQRIAIHAGARPIKAAEIRALIIGLRGSRQVSNPCLRADIALPVLENAAAILALPLSAVVCTAIVGEPKRGDICAAEFGEHAGNDSDRGGTFNWGWPMLDIEPIANIPARGAQGLWDWRT